MADIGIDPLQRFEMKLPTGVVVHCKYMTRRELREMRTKFSQAQELEWSGKESEADAKLVECLAVAFGDESKRIVESLTDCTEPQIVDFFGGIEREQWIAEAARKKSESPSPLGTGNSVSPDVAANAVRNVASLN